MRIRAIDRLVERFSHLSVTDRYEIMNDGSNSGHFWRGFEVIEFQFLTTMPKVAGIGAIVYDFISVDGRQLRSPLYCPRPPTSQRRVLLLPPPPHYAATGVVLSVSLCLSLSLSLSLDFVLNIGFYTSGLVRSVPGSTWSRPVSTADHLVTSGE